MTVVACSPQARLGGGADAGDDACAGFDCTDAGQQRTVKGEIDRVCSQVDGCHGSGAGNFGMSLGHEFDSMIGAVSSENPPMLRAMPGDPAHSYVWLKIHCDAGTCPGIDGGRMPKDTAYDPALDRLFFEWIEAGAPRD